MPQKLNEHLKRPRINHSTWKLLNYKKMQTSSLKGFDAYKYIYISIYIHKHNVCVCTCECEECNLAIYIIQYIK